MRTNVILAVIAGALAIPTYLTIRADSASFTRYEDVPRLFEGFTPENIAVVQVSKPKLDDEGKPVQGANDQIEREVLRLQRTPNGWVMGQGTPIAGAPLRANAVNDQILEHVEAIRRDDKALVATSADDETLARYSLDEASATLIQCLDVNNKIVAELFLGRSARDATQAANSLPGFFVRRKEFRDVVLYERDGWFLDLSPAGWLDRTGLPSGAGAKVVSLRLQNEKGSATFTKDKASDVRWTASEAPPDSGAVRQGEVDSIVSRLARVAIANYEQPLPADDARRALALKQFGLDTPAATAVLRVDDGTEYTISVGNKVTDKAEYYAVFSNRDFVVTIADRSAFDSDPLALFDISAEAAGAVPQDDTSTKPQSDAPRDDDKK